MVHWKKRNVKMFDEKVKSVLVPKEIRTKMILWARKGSFLGPKGSFGQVKDPFYVQTYLFH